MARRSPKAIGTAGESAVVAWLKGQGWDDADRIPPSGNRDRGDVVINLTPLVIAEVKSGQAAETASSAVIREWLAQTETERVNIGADMAVLVVRRFRRPVSAWDVWLPLADVVRLDSGVRGFALTPVRLSLADFSALLTLWVAP